MAVMHRIAPSSAEKGFSLLEVVIVLTIMAILSASAYPLLRNTVRREREVDLRESLRSLRKAVDDYKRYNDLTGGQAE